MTKPSSHTPGPWTEDSSMEDADGNEFDSRENGWTRVRGSDGDCVCNDIDISTPEGEANLRLVIAAPDLLEALHDLVGNIMSPEPRNLDLADALAAIAKATGDQ